MGVRLLRCGCSLRVAGSTAVQGISKGTIGSVGVTEVNPTDHNAMAYPSDMTQQ